MAIRYYDKASDRYIFDWLKASKSQKEDQILHIVNKQLKGDIRFKSYVAYRSWLADAREVMKYTRKGMIIII